MTTTTCNIVRGCERPAAHFSYEHAGKAHRVCHMHLGRLRRGSELGGAAPKAVGKIKRHNVAAALHLAEAVQVTKRHLWVGVHRISIEWAVYYALPFKRRHSAVYEVPVARVTAWKARGWVVVRPEKDRDGFVVRVTPTGRKAVAEALRGGR